MVIKILAILAILMAPAQAARIHIDVLRGDITEATIARLNGLVCHNYDKIVHLDISIEMPESDIVVEPEGYQRMMVILNDSEYLFPKGSYVYAHGAYVIDGYFIVKSGGTHQGTNSAAFEQTDAELVLLNPHVVETVARDSACP